MLRWGSVGGGWVSDRCRCSLQRSWTVSWEEIGSCCIGGREVSLEVPCVPGVTYSRSVVVPIVFQVRLDVCSSRMGRCSLPSWEIGPTSELFCRDETCSSPSSACFGWWGGVRHGRHVWGLRVVFQVLCQGDWRRVVTLCPVLKHGPRSARDARVGRVVLGP